MNSKVLLIVGMCVTGALWAGVSAQQEMQARPGPGSGVMNVNVINHPAVTAAQSGEWQVSLTRPADVRITNNPNITVSNAYFLARGTAYRITWSGEERETVTVTEVGGGGWVQVQSAGARRWINVSIARVIEEAR